MAKSEHPIPIPVKLLAVLMTLVVSGIGALAVMSHHAPERSTRHGLIPALEGAQADAFGITIMVVGLLPLALLMGTARRAAWFGCVIGLLAAGTLLIHAH